MAKAVPRASQAFPWRACRVDRAGLAGALSIAEYEQGLASTGFTEIEITPTHEVADGMHSAFIKAREPPKARRSIQTLC
jgi:hypothetical protein